MKRDISSHLEYKRELSGKENFHHEKNDGKTQKENTFSFLTSEEF